MRKLTTAPMLSVVIPTQNRAPLLEDALRSLGEQTLPVDDYEVLVIDDGSVDATPQICRRLSSGRMHLRYLRLPSVGLSAAKNLGVFVSSGVLTLFFDDDEIADRALLMEHVRAHQRHPEEHVAVLGYTTWAPDLGVTEVMHYITEVGQMLFSYPSLHDGELLGFTKFYGGRTSCKRNFLARRGVFDQRMPGLEDFELGYRLSRYGLRVLFHRSAATYINRPITYDQFCQRCEKQGRYRWQFIQLHPDPALQEHLGVENAAARWRERKQVLDEEVRRVHELEALLERPADEAKRALLRRELHALYKATFRSFYLKGTAEAMAAHDLSVQQILSGPPEQAPARGSNQAPVRTDRVGQAS